MFHPMFGLTEVPFPERADCLLRRLGEADSRTLPFVLSAVVDALGIVSGRMMPPSVVGGRLAPESWHPATYGDLSRLQQDLGRRALAVAGGGPELRGPARLFVIRNLHSFAGHGLVAELRGLLDGDAELRQAVRLELHRLVTHRQEVRARWPHPTQPDPVLESLRAWSDELAPTDLIARVKERTAMSPWEVTRGDREQEGHAEKTDPYTPLAEEVLRQPDVLGQLADWFNSDGPQSSPHFGHALGLADVGDTVAPTVVFWLDGGNCRGVAGGDPARRRPPGRTA